MGCKCCRWPVNACKMARMVRLLPLSFTALVLFLTVHSFYNDALITGTLLLILFFPVLDFPKRKPLKLPPGPSGVPVLGYLPFLGENPHQEMAKLAQKYGPLVHIQLGSFPGFVVANARLAKEVLMTQDQVFASQPDSLVTWAEHFTYSNLEDSSIRFTRRLVAAELMAPKRKEFFKAIQSEEMDAMVQELQSKMKDGKHVVDLHLAIGAMAMNITTRMVMKKRYYYTKDVSSETVEKEASQFQKLLVTCARRPFLQDVVPPLMSLISSSNNREMAKVTKHTDAIIDTILREHRQRPNALESNQDIMDMLTQSVGEDGKPLDDNAIKAVTMEMLVAGTEITARATEWVLAELIRHPEIQAEVESELDAVIGRTRVAQECDIPNLQYLQAVVRETGRLHPVVPLLRAPSNPEPTELDGYHVPAHSHVFVNLWAMGRDPALWDRPERFDPARFLAQAGEDQMGMHVVVSVAVARLVHGFRWWATDMDVGERFGWSLQMKAPLCRVCCEARLPA